MLLYYSYITYPHRRVTLTAKRVRLRLPAEMDAPLTNPLTNAIWACVGILELAIEGRWSEKWTEEEKKQVSKGLSSGEIQYCLGMSTRPPQYPWLDRLKASLPSRDEQFLAAIKKLKRPSQEIWNRCNYLCRLGILKATHALSDPPETRRRHSLRYRLGPKAATDLHALWRLRRQLRAAHTEDTYSSGIITVIGLVGWTKISADLRNRLVEQMEEIASSIARELDSARTLREKRDFPLVVIDPDYVGATILPKWLVVEQKRLWELKKRSEKTDKELGISSKVSSKVS